MNSLRTGWFCRNCGNPLGLLVKPRDILSVWGCHAEVTYEHLIRHLIRKRGSDLRNNEPNLYKFRPTEVPQCGNSGTSTHWRETAELPVSAPSLLWIHWQNDPQLPRTSLVWKPAHLCSCYDCFQPCQYISRTASVYSSAQCLETGKMDSRLLSTPTFS